MPRAVVTGAFSYTGSAVALHLAERGWTVDTLTNRRRPEHGAPHVCNVDALHFDTDHLARTLDGADALVDTYWIRLPHDRVTFDTAVANSRRLFDAARRAGVRRVLHVSVSNAAHDSPLAYYRGKAQVDDALRASGGSYAIVRPTLIVGPRDVLTNNIAWFLRRFPWFAIPGDGSYRIQPVTLDDTGSIIADAVESPDKALEVDASGPDILSFRSYVELVACAIGRPNVRMVCLPNPIALALSRIPGLLLRDTVLAAEELLGLQHESLVSQQRPLGTQPVAPWLQTNADALGRSYVNDTHRHFGRGRTIAV